MVKGCHNFYERQRDSLHEISGVPSRALNAEVERLRGEIFNNVCHHVFFCHIPVIFTFVKLDI